MTLPKVVIQLCEAWIEEHGRVEFTQENGRDELVSAVMALQLQHYHGKQKGAVESSVKSQIRTIRGVIHPEKTKKGFKKRKIGEATSNAPENTSKINAKNNPKNSAINNPKNNAINNPKNNPKNNAKNNPKNNAKYAKKGDWQDKASIKTILPITRLHS